MVEGGGDMGVDFRRVGVPELSKFPAGSASLALEPQQTARVKVTAKAAADLLRPGTPNSAEIDTHGAYAKQCLLRRPRPLPSDRAMPGYRDNLESKIQRAHQSRTRPVPLN